MLVSSWQKRATLTTSCVLLFLCLTAMRWLVVRCFGNIHCPGKTSWILVSCLLFAEKLQSSLVVPTNAAKTHQVSHKLHSCEDGTSKMHSTFAGETISLVGATHFLCQGASSFDGRSWNLQIKEIWQNYQRRPCKMIKFETTFGSQFQHFGQLTGCVFGNFELL